VVKRRVELYLYSPLWAFVICSTVNFTIYLVSSVEVNFGATLYAYRVMKLSYLTPIYHNIHIYCLQSHNVLIL